MESHDNRIGALYRSAHDELMRCGDSASLEAIWFRAGLESIVANRTVDPPVDQLKKMTLPERAWDNQPWPPELNAERAQCLSDCIFFAITLKDCLWLEQLNASWENPPVSYEWHVLSKGQIGLGLRRYGVQSTFWMENDWEWLLEQESLTTNTPYGRAWIALSNNDFVSAKQAVHDYRIEMEKWKNGWNELTGDSVWGVLSLPGKILFLELRALEALVSNE